MNWLSRILPAAEQPERTMPADRKQTDKPTKEHVDKMLDEALEETFSASDAVAITQPLPAEMGSLGLALRGGFIARPRHAVTTCRASRLPGLSLRKSSRQRGH